MNRTQSLLFGQRVGRVQGDVELDDFVPVFLELSLQSLKLFLHYPDSNLGEHHASPLVVWHQPEDQSADKAAGDKTKAIMWLHERKGSFVASVAENAGCFDGHGDHQTQTGRP